MTRVLILLVLLSSVVRVEADDEVPSEVIALDIGYDEEFSEESVLLQKPGEEDNDVEYAPPDCLKREPTAQQTVKAAWKSANLEPEKDASMRHRARVANWLPKLKGGVSKDIGGRWDFRYEPGEPRIDQLHRTDGWGFDIGVSWDFSDLVFDSEEIRVLQQSSHRVLERMEVASAVLDLYFTRLELLKTGIPKPGSKAALSYLEATARLDIWTGGVFHKRWCEVMP